MESVILCLSESFKAGDKDVLSMFDEALISVKKENAEDTSTKHNYDTFKECNHEE